MPNTHPTLKALFSDMADKIRAKKGTSGMIVADNFPLEIESITTGIEPEKLTFDQRNALVKAYLDAADAAYTDTNQSTSVIATYAGQSASYDKDRPAGIDIYFPAAGNMIISDEQSFLANMLYSRLAPGVSTVFNLTPQYISDYVIRTAGDKDIIACGTVTPSGALRMIRDSAARNVRDIGGWACDGGSIRYNLLFRGGEVNGYGALVYIGVTDDFDLRGATGITESPMGVPNYHRYDGYPWYGAEKHIDDTSISYSYANDTYTHVILEDIMDAVIGQRICYVHCAEGADRTGSIMFMIEAILGVAQADMDKDYELTCFYTGVDTDGHARRRNETEWHNLITAFDSFGGSNIRDKVVNWLITRGVKISKINKFRQAMINGAPEILTSGAETYSVTNTLTDTTTSNMDSTCTEYQPYSATLTPAQGYIVTSISVTMGGVDVTDSRVRKIYNAEGNVVSAKIDIPSVSGTIAVTAISVASAPSYTNLFDYSDSTINYRFNSSNGEYPNNGYFLTASIPCDQTGGCKTLRVKGATFGSNSKLVGYNANGTAVFAYMKNYLNVITDANGVSSVKVGWYESTANDPSTDHEGSSARQIQTIRLALYISSAAIPSQESLSDVIITLDEEIG